MSAFKEAKKGIKRLKTIVLNEDYNNFIKNAETRIKAKKKILK